MIILTTKIKISGPSISVKIGDQGSGIGARIEFCTARYHSDLIKTQTHTFHIIISTLILE